MNDVVKFQPKMTIDDKLDALMQKLIEIDLHVTELRSTLVSTFHDECCPKRKEVSKALGKAVTNRMKGEFLARQATAPIPAYWCDRCDSPHPEGFICK